LFVKTIPELRILLERIIDLGITSEDDFLQKRKVRLINSIMITLSGLGLLFSILFLFIQDYEQAFIALTGTAVVCVPTLFFNHRGLQLFAKLYFIVLMLIVFSANSFFLISQGRNVNTEVVLISMFALVIILFEQRLKLLFCSLIAASFLILLSFKYDYSGWAFDADYITTIAHYAVTFLLIYIFTNIFKKDLLKSLDKVKVYNARLADRQQKILDQSNQLMLHRNMKRSLIDNIPMLLAIIDLDGKFLIVNKEYEKIFRVPVKEIEGKYLKDILPAELHEQQDALFIKACNGENTKFTKQITFPGGVTIHAHGMYIAVTNSNGSTTSVAHYMSDITEVKIAEEKLKHLNATKDKLLSIVSHDLQGPIHSLQRLLSLSGDISNEDLARYMSQINHQVHTISFTMDNILKWVKSQLDGLTSEKKQVNLSKIVSESTRLLESNIIAKELQINNNIKEEDTAFVDEDNISLVVRNLLSNAIKFTPQGGEINLNVVKKDESIDLVVSDNGVGMHEEKINNIKNSQFSISNKGTNGERGTGLGLIFCKDVLALNNGHLHIVSDLNKGTKMTVNLPSSAVPEQVS
jgi:PAS domain S-box-containing protein